MLPSSNSSSGSDYTPLGSLNIEESDLGSDVEKLRVPSRSWINGLPTPDELTETSFEGNGRSGRWPGRTIMLIRRLRFALTPSFMRREEKAKPTYPTTWLDGLRGYAALVVFLAHFVYNYLDRTRLVYGTVLPRGSILIDGTFVPYNQELPEGDYISLTSNGRRNENLWFIQLPFVRLLMSGFPMVSIFFVVSGYALSLKPMRLIRQGIAGRSQLLQTLASTVFRRPIRLLLPGVISTFCTLIAVRLGMFNFADKIAGTEDIYRESFRGWAYEPPIHIAPTLWGQLVDWSVQLYTMMDFFNHEHWPLSNYDLHLWTIPVEFRCSLLLFLTIAGTALLRSQARRVLLTSFIVLAWSWGDCWEMGLFWAGMLLCEIDMVREEEESAMNGAYSPSINEKDEDDDDEDASDSDDDYEELPPLQKRWIFAFLTSFYLLSYPEIFAERSRVYYYLSLPHVPGIRQESQYRIRHCVGAVLLVMTVSRCAQIKAFFSNSLARYLGRISYALYMVHGPILRSLGFSLVYNLWLSMNGGNDDISRLSDGKYHSAVFITFLVVFPTVIWAADLFCRAVDEPIVRLSRRVEESMEEDVVADRGLA